MDAPLDRLLGLVRRAQSLFRARLERLVDHEGGLTLERYARYLSMQFHLTRGVQRHFLAAAAHPDMARVRGLRHFLIRFAEEEEPHFALASKDLAALGREVLACPLDVELWWAYFDGVVGERPFLRLGATCVLENLGSGASEVITRMLRAADYLRPENSRFFRIHRHEELPHGDQILDALRAEDLTRAEVQDLERGAEVATVLYLRMVEWALDETRFAEGGLLGLISATGT